MSEITSKKKLSQNPPRRDIEQKEKLVQWISKEITSREYTDKEMKAMIYWINKGQQAKAWKILLKGHKCLATCQHCKLTNFIHQELNNQQKTKEEKVETILTFCLSHLNWGIKEEWEKRKMKAELFTILAEHETKIMKQEIFKNYINKEIVKKMEF